MANKSIWLVQGCCGEYDDKRDWVICGYSTKRLAEKHMKLAQERAAELASEYDSYFDIPKGANQYDPDGLNDYTGVSYSIYSVDLRDKIPGA